MSTDIALDRAASPAVGGPGLSELGRVGNTFVAPSKTFADLARRATWMSWLTPFLLIVVFTIASGYAVQQQVGFDRVYMNQLHSSPTQEDQLNNAPPERKAAAMKLGTTITRTMAYGAPVLLIVAFGVYALLIWASFNFGLGAQTSFWQVFAVTWYAALPYLLRSLLIILTVCFGGNAEAFEYKNPVGTNPGYYMPDAAGWLRALLGTVDLIQIWSLVLMILGMSILARKSFTQSAVIVGLFWLLTVIIAVVGGAIGG